MLERVGAKSRDLRDSSGAWGCPVHALSACVSPTLVGLPSRGDTSIPALTLLSTHSHLAQPHLPLVAQPSKSRPSAATLPRPRSPCTVGHSALVGTAEWVWQPWSCFPLEVAVSDCQSHQPWGLLGVS